MAINDIYIAAIQRGFLSGCSDRKIPGACCILTMDMKNDSIFYSGTVPITSHLMAASAWLYPQYDFDAILLDRLSKAAFDFKQQLYDKYPPVQYKIGQQTFTLLFNLVDLPLIISIFSDTSENAFQVMRDILKTIQDINESMHIYDQSFLDLIEEIGNKSKSGV